MKAAVTLNPSTPVSMLNDVIADLDMVLIMTVNPDLADKSLLNTLLQRLRNIDDNTDRL